MNIWLQLLFEELKKNAAFKLISLAAIIASLIVYSNLNEMTSLTNNMQSIFLNLSFGYIASYIFYIINIFIPNLNKRYRDYSILASALARIDYNIMMLQKTFNINPYSLELTPYYQQQSPKAMVLFTRRLSFLLGFFSSDIPSRQLITEANKEVTSDINKMNESYQLLGTPLIATGLSLHGVAQLLITTLHHTSSLPIAERQYFLELSSIVSHRLIDGNELDVIEKIKDININILHAQLNHIASRLKELYSSNYLSSVLLMLKNEFEIATYGQASKELHRNIIEYAKSS